MRPVTKDEVARPFRRESVHFHYRQGLKIPANDFSDSFGRQHCRQQGR
jgi:hypothetical protein